MEETAGAPSSFAALSPRRLRASSRDGGGVVNRPPSPLTMLLSRHTRRRDILGALGGGLAWPLASGAQQPKRVGVVLQGGAHFAGLAGVRDAFKAAQLPNVSVLVREGKAIFVLSRAQPRSLRPQAWM